MTAGKYALASLPEPRIQERSSSAIAFVQACGHASLDTASLSALHQMGLPLSEGEWNEVLGYALVERMECLTLAHLSAAGLLPHLPEYIRSTFSEVYRGTLVTNLKLRNTTVTLVEAFAQQGIQAICIKGVVLALRCYQEIAHRPVGDIDLLVRPRDVEESSAILQASGFRPISGTARPLAFQSLRTRTLGFERPDGHMVELHWSLTGMPPYARRFDSADVWTRVQEMQINGHTVRHLDRYDELRYLCFHYAAQHQAQRFLWLVDIAEMLPPEADIQPGESAWEWDVFLSETIALGLALPVGVALARAHRLLDATVPQWVLSALGSAADSSTERAGWRSSQDHQYAPTSLLRYLLALDEPRQRIAFLAGSLRWGPRAWARWGFRALAKAAHLS